MTTGTHPFPSETLPGKKDVSSDTGHQNITVEECAGQTEGNTGDLTRLAAFGLIYSKKYMCTY